MAFIPICIVLLLPPILRLLRDLALTDPVRRPCALAAHAIGLPVDRVVGVAPGQALLVRVLADPGRGVLVDDEISHHPKVLVREDVAVLS